MPYTDWTTLEMVFELLAALDAAELGQVHTRLLIEMHLRGERAKGNKLNHADTAPPKSQVPPSHR